ncbi:MAG TPA: 16S rRNA (cytosine(1402)-N(4))-methyltransferase RsmH [Syntrophorhabdaceae bacterium]|nr:16S rRNA (cytosine(1402)-N(4))-methyltransferase RsmH [Syntrophorhabdaceae bacterium]
MNGVTHIPVLLEEVLHNLVGIEDGLFVDATLGGGGHTYGILERFSAIRVIGIDADEVALTIAEEALRDFKDRVRLVKGNFRTLRQILQGVGVSSIDGILFDLGTSVYQIMGKRGFSFNDETDLDMRMDTKDELRAWDVVNGYRINALERILFEYGEEEKAHKIARAIVEARKKRPIQTAKELGDIVARVKWRRGRIHPATKTFQAIRIEVNGELENLKEGVASAIDMLNVKGRIGVITFHSLEDRMIKQTFRGALGVATLTKKPIRPQRKEMLSNPRSRSAKLRIAEKL